VVVAEREVGKVAMEVEDHVAVKVHEEVALALLEVDEPLHLKKTGLREKQKLPGKHCQGCMSEFCQEPLGIWGQGKKSLPLACCSRRGTGISGSLDVQ
jgi:hypothetical protein